VARTVTIGDLKTRTRERADCVSDTEFITDAELGRLLDEAYCELVDFLVTADIHQFETTDTVTITAGVDTYPLPDDLYKLLGVDFQWSTSPVRYEEIPLLGFSERNDYANLLTSGVSVARASGYRIVGDGIQFIPQPPTGQVYKLSYAPAPADFASLPDATLIDGIAGYDALLVVMAAANIRVKEESSSYRELLAERDRLIARIVQQGWDRAPVQQIAEGREDGARDYDAGYGRSRYRRRDDW
jgi:hypothetical protein